MLKYIIKRILWVIPVMLGVLAIAFVLNLMTPGDPVTSILGTGATQEARDQVTEELGLNDPVIVRFGKYVWNFATRLDMGTSYVTKQPVRDEILGRYPVTLKLAFGSILLAMAVGIPLGVISAVKQYSWIDNAATAVSMVAVSVPSFWLGLMLILLFAVNLKLLPAAGISNPLGWILPIVVIGFSSAASIARVTRSSMLESIRQDYIDTARAKGLGEGTIMVRHGLRNALIPIITAVGNQIGIQLGGALAIESVFAVPGLGKYLVEAINARDYPAVQGGVVFLALVFSIVNLVIDITYTLVDPRVKIAMLRESAIKQSRKAMKKQKRQLGAAS